jgi:hypothetical protein
MQYQQPTVKNTMSTKHSNYLQVSKELIFHDCTPMYLKSANTPVRARANKNLSNTFLKYFESIRYGANVNVPSHQVTSNVDHLLKPKRTVTKPKRFVSHFRIPPKRCFRFLPSEYELNHVDVVSVSNFPPLIKNFMILYFNSEIICACEYAIWTRMQSGFSNSVKNIHIGILPYECWQLLFSDYEHEKFYTNRTAFINNVKIHDEIEHKAFSLAKTGMPPLLTKYWYQKSYRDGKSGSIYCCTVQNISFNWNVRNHLLDVSLNYTTEHLNTFDFTWGLSG